MKIKKYLNLDNLLITIFILLIAGGGSLFRDTYSFLFLFVILCVVFFRRRMTIGRNLLILVFLWLIINFVSLHFINTGQDISFITVLARLLRYVLIYFLIKLVGNSFFDKLNKYVFILVILGFPFFFIQIVSPEILKGLWANMSLITRPDFAEEGSWYGFIYMFTVHHPERNSGFMWEPGAFAGILILLITYRLSVTNFKVDKYIYVYIAAVITSMSTAGYLALTIIIFAYFINKRKRYAFLVLFLPLVIYFGINFYKNTDFLSGKIDIYLDSGTNRWGRNEDGTPRVSRLGYAIVILDESLHWPFGHGIIEHSNYKKKKYGKVWGPGMLSSNLHQWGWIGLTSIFLFLYQFYRINIDRLSSLFFTVAFGILLFSNPDAFQFIILSIICFVFAFGKMRKHKLNIQGL